MRLSLARFLNLVYFYVVENMDVKDRRKFDNALFRKQADPTAPPAWWGSDEEATQSGLAAARAMGLKIPALT